jgi:hypothetical protein
MSLGSSSPAFQRGLEGANGHGLGHGEERSREIKQKTPKRSRQSIPPVRLGNDNSPWMARISLNNALASDVCWHSVFLRGDWLR